MSVKSGHFWVWLPITGREDYPNCYPSIEEINWMTINGLHESICPERQILNECFSNHLDEIAIHT